MFFKERRDGAVNACVCMIFRLWHPVITHRSINSTPRLGHTWLLYNSLSFCSFCIHLVGRVSDWVGLSSFIFSSPPCCLARSFVLPYSLTTAGCQEVGRYRLVELTNPREKREEEEKTPSQPCQLLVPTSSYYIVLKRLIMWLVLASSFVGGVPLIAYYEREREFFYKLTSAEWITLGVPENKFKYWLHEMGLLPDWTTFHSLEASISLSELPKTCQWTEFEAVKLCVMFGQDMVRAFSDEGCIFF